MCSSSRCALIPKICVKSVKTPNRPQCGSCLLEEYMEQHLNARHMEWKEHPVTLTSREIRGEIEADIRNCTKSFHGRISADEIDPDALYGLLHRVCKRFAKQVLGEALVSGTGDLRPGEGYR